MQFPRTATVMLQANARACISTACTAAMAARHNITAQHIEHS